MKFHGEDVLIEEATDESFAGMDYVLGAVKNGMSKRFAPAIVKSGAVYIDNSSAFRLDENVPLVVPEINGADAFENKGIIANPNCSTIITLMAVAGLAKLSPIKAMVEAPIRPSPVRVRRASLSFRDRWKPLLPASRRSTQLSRRRSA